jgi:hypothetical protein
MIGVRRAFNFIDSRRNPLVGSAFPKYGSASRSLAEVFATGSDGYNADGVTLGAAATARRIRTGISVGGRTGLLGVAGQSKLRQQLATANAIVLTAQLLTASGKSNERAVDCLQSLQPHSYRASTS